MEVNAKGESALGSSLIATFLREQKQLSAVEKYAQWYSDPSRDDRQNHYLDLIPAGLPGVGQQYAFDVSLDDCTGCKACVSACHSLNGLDEQEVWRKVGLLQGGTVANPVLQTVTTACHHCVDPACMSGCPVQAYEKDPITGIVKHLDDQCIGCQYCVLTCPYEVPTFNASKGIVRKCDMCSNRLAQNEAPACVQGCPNKAIRIRVVDQEEVRADSAGSLVAEAPASSHTHPTTRYRSERPVRNNMVPADQQSRGPRPSHPPLVVFLVLSQLAVGAVCADLFLSLFGSGPAVLSRYIALAGWGVGMISLGASTLHLGRPVYAFRAVLGVRTSWLSREVLAFGGFAAVAGVYVASSFGLLGVIDQGGAVTGPLRIAAAASGLIAVFCSAMVYGVTSHELWRPIRSLGRFGFSAAILGSATAVALTTTFAVALPSISVADAWSPVCIPLLLVVLFATIVKVGTELAVFRAPHGTSLSGTAVLLRGPLRTIFRLRCVAALSGGLLLPVAAFIVPLTVPAALAVAWSVGILCLIGELLARHLFFVSVASPTMPGGVAMTRRH